ncbi:MAG: (d)CMP kinase [Ectothiorhodospiraceae bacterium]|nr:(d)CMP kinase [Chromatiales bacterium]MCP5156893.1 (d)CMP kinase [Ectothiorhodospiraceae bacterium]
MRRPAPVVTVDGPSGVGKGTLARLLAQRLGFHLLDSGALYRLVGFCARRAGVAFDDPAALAGIARELDVEFVAGDSDPPLRARVAGTDVSDDIRTEAAGRDASLVAAVPAVREALLARQRDFRVPPGLVADGRDMGTVVFPDAEVKLFLTASAEERAHRRYKQLIAKGIDATLTRLSAEIAERDRRDSERAVAPLRPAEDAVVVDTSSLSIDDVLARALQVAAARGVCPRP